MTIQGEKMFSKNLFLARKIKKYGWMAGDCFIYQNNMKLVPSSSNLMILGKKLIKKTFKID